MFAVVVLDTKKTKGLYIYIYDSIFLMVTIQINLEKSDYDKVIRLKSNMTWKDFLLSKSAKEGIIVGKSDKINVKKNIKSDLDLILDFFSLLNEINFDGTPADYDKLKEEFNKFFKIELSEKDFNFICADDGLIMLGNIFSNVDDNEVVYCGHDNECVERIIEELKMLKEKNFELSKISNVKLRKFIFSMLNWMKKIFKEKKIVL